MFLVHILHSHNWRSILLHLNKLALQGILKQTNEFIVAS